MNWFSILPLYFIRAAKINSTLFIIKNIIIKNNVLSIIYVTKRNIELLILLFSVNGNKIGTKFPDDLNKKYVILIH